jgi:hypothetical protein
VVSAHAGTLDADIVIDLQILADTAACRTGASTAALSILRLQLGFVVSATVKHANDRLV